MDITANEIPEGGNDDAMDNGEDTVIKEEVTIEK